MKKIFSKIQNPFFYSTLSGLLMAAAWYSPFTLLIFLAIVPILHLQTVIEESTAKHKAFKFWAHVVWAFSLWNFGVIWWLWNAAGWASIPAWVLNAILQSLPLLAFFIVSQKRTNKFGYISFVLFWLAFEYLHLHWEFSWVWLNLGNVFGNLTQVVQWYEYTGTFGGSLWVLVVNVLLYRAIFENPSFYKGVLASFLVPLLISVYILSAYNRKGRPVEIVATQPNLDCYTEKFRYNSKSGEQNTETYIPVTDQVTRFVAQLESAVTSQTQFILFPETAISESVLLDDVQDNPHLNHFRSILYMYPNLSIITGIDLFKIYKPNEERSETVRTHSQIGDYDVYSSAYFISNDSTEDVYNKSKLVIGVETIPFKKFFENLILDFGGTSGSLAVDKERKVFTNKEKINAAPVICYESIYGEFVTEYVQKGANFIAVITNDGWWGDTPGCRQHLSYSKLRAIELRKNVVRSANTGISCFIDQLGRVYSQTKYGIQTTLREDIYINDHITVYAKFGDIIGRLSSFLTVLILISAFAEKLKQKKINKR